MAMVAIGSVVAARFSSQPIKVAAVLIGRNGSQDDMDPAAAIRHTRPYLQALTLSPWDEDSCGTLLPDHS